MLEAARRHESWIRVALVLPFVLVCYLFEWSTWRAGVCGTFVGLSHMLSLPVVRASSDAFYSQGHFYRFAIACTALDAYFGSIPLLWMDRKSIRSNVVFFVKYLVALEVLNLARLAAGLWIFARGVPWAVSHEAFAGVFYFGVFLWIARRRGWTRENDWRHEWREIEAAIAG